MTVIKKYCFTALCTLLCFIPLYGTQIRSMRSFRFPEEKLELSVIPASAKGDGVGYVLYDPESHRIIDAHNDTVAFIPASVTKVATAAAALGILGKDTRFHTELLASGTVEGRHLSGDIWLKGYGDPQLGTNHLLAFVDILLQHNIRSISGSFYYDVSFFPTLSVVEATLGEMDTYNTGVGPLSLNHNLIRARWKRNARNAPGRWYFLPPLPYLMLQIPGAHVQGWSRYSHQEKNGKEIYTQNAASQLSGTTTLPVKNPGRFAAETLRHLCLLRGINLPDAAPGIAPAEARLLYTQYSATVEEITSTMLENSNNMLAETLLFAIGRKIFSKPATHTETAYYLQHSFFPDQMPHVSWTNFVMVNGSGLTSANRMTPQQAVALMLYADSVHPYTGAFFRMLPLSGSRGTLSGILDETDTLYRVQAKTGYIFYARTLAGRVFAQNGDAYIMALFSHDLGRRAILDADKAGSALNTAKAGVGGWRAAADQRFYRIIKEWIEKVPAALEKLSTNTKETD